MALTGGTLTMTHQWQQTHAETGYSTTRNQGTSTKTIAPTISAGAANRIYKIQATLAAGASVTIDLSAVTEGTFGEVLAPIRAYTVRADFATTTWKYEPGASNPLTWFFSGTLPAHIGVAGDGFAHGSATATTIDGTHKTIKITNTNGAALVLTYTVEWILGV